ncbi:hypothetical protein PF004_g19461 [Phytophthora fragariae]|uniref:Uncharacterized protein n=1 Tax=Phytophthora fragariae TaxID=53985 RepID=A0A6G0N8Z8_9STRA|nr:hypothetical protein PF004_g19461 [Phytophthora fragariae]
MIDAGSPRERSQRISKFPTDVVRLSYFCFTVWWFIILGVHMITCLYNAVYAYCYWKLKSTYLNVCLDFYKIGMPQPYHNAIAIVHASMSAIHGVCILLMLSGSVWQRSLAFTPWSSCVVGPEAPTGPTRSLLDRLEAIYDKVTYPLSVFGVKGKYFEVALISREVVETALQTVQAYRMSALLPRALLNRFYVVLLVINCWSSPLIDIAIYKHDKARRRFVCTVLDCLLDLMACMGIELIVLFDELTSVPLVLARLAPFYLYLTGNPMSELPPEIFGIGDMVYLGVGDMDISQLPPNVTNVSPSLSVVVIDNTNISFFWSWVDELVGRAVDPAVLLAGGSSYCENLKQNTTPSFPPQYSTLLMNSSEANPQVVNCNYISDGPYYPLHFDDSINAISTPPPLKARRQQSST